MKNDDIIARFHFSSDHRPGRCTIKVNSKNKLLNYKKSKTNQKRILPLHKTPQASQKLKEKINLWSSKDSANASDLFRRMEKSILDVVNEFESWKEKPSTTADSREGRVM